MKKKLLAILLVLIMVVGMAPTVAFAAGSETVYLAFTSDVHHGNSSSGLGSPGGSVTGADRLDNWLDGVATHLGGISFKAMGFCGDNGSGYANSETAYWNYVQEVIDVVDENDHVENFYFTAGNHEHINGKIGSTTNETAKNITVIGKAVETDSYIIYCFGASQQGEEFTEKNINTLKAYLENEYDSVKPIFILTHFPLHTYSSRTTKNADKVIDLLNGYPNVVFLWGHNHTMSDPNYDRIFNAGSTLTYATGSTKEINFTYCAAGCMSDSEYSSGSQSVEGKGLVVKVEDGKIEFTYYDLSYASADSEPEDPVIPGVAPEDGKQYVIVADDGYALTTEEGAGYSNNGSGSQKYNYKGLKGIPYTSGMEITDDMLWTFTASGGGYNISNGGNYLNGVYKKNSTGGYDGTLGLDDVTDVWILSGGLLKSANASNGTSGDKYLTHGNGDASENLFSVRSNDNASTLKFYEVGNGEIVIPEVPEEPEENTVYKQVSAFTDGREYLIVDESTSSGKFYALINKGGTSSGANMDRTEVTIVDDIVDYIVTDETDIVWFAAANGEGFNLTNGGDYLEGKSGEVKIYNSNQYPERYWTYVDDKLQHKGGTNTYTVYYSSGNFTSSYKTAGEEVYLFEKVVEQECAHSYCEWVVTREATCTETGAKTRTCTKCGETETSLIEAKGHTEVTDAAIAPTCTATGLTEGKHCSVCNEAIAVQEEIQALGHTSGGPVRENEVAATETKNGSYDEVVYCTVCGIKLSSVTKTIPATGGSIHSDDSGGSDYSGGSGGSDDSGGGESGEVIHYTLTFNTDGGSAIDSLSRSSGTVVDLSAYVPTKDGFVFGGWYADKALTEKITSVELKKDTTVYAKWTEKADSVKLPFTDVKDGDWFYGDVKDVYENGLMKGTGDTTFSPDVTTSRGMIVTILYRLDGEPAVSGNCPFDDVAAGMYYENAIIWAAANSIVNGYGNNKFGPNDSITREQMAVILYRYANYKGYDVSVGEDKNILSFDDAFSISEYAIPAIKWACGSGIINGTSATTLSPQGNATRAQAAAILHRFCELIEK